MKILLDSDILSALGELEGDNFEKAYHFITTFSHPPAQLCACILTIYEMNYGLMGVSDSEKKEKVKAFIQSIKNRMEIIPLGFEDAEIYGKLKHSYKNKTGTKQKELKRHNIDIALASVAIANQCVLIGGDKIYSKHLKELDSRLQCENWK